MADEEAKKQNELNKAIAEANKLQEKALEIVRKRAAQEAEISKSASNYFRNLKEIGALQKNILHIEKQLEKADDKSKDAIKEELKNLNKTKDELVAIVKQTNKLALGWEGVNKIASQLPNLLASGYNKIKSAGLFDMDKSIRMAGLQMGLLGDETTNFRKTLTRSVTGLGQLNEGTVALGIGVEELAKMQADYSDDLGRNVMFSQQANEAIAELAKGTVLGADGAAKMASEMNLVGMGVEETRDFVQQTMNDSHKMGLNASKVIKNISANIKLLNKYNFKGGAKGLAQMAEATTKMGVDIAMVAPMADKLFNIEGAVDMSAQLQVMGGEWAKLADPFKLMHMARTDMAGLTKEVINAAKGTAQFNKETGEFDISALELSRLRQVAEATGLDFDQLATSAKKAAMFTKINGQIKIDADPSTKEFIENTATLNEKGEAKIMIGTSPKLLKDLQRGDIKLIKEQAEAKSFLKERAIESQTFDDQIKNLITMFKTTMLPVVDGLSKTLLPTIKKLFGDEKFKTQLASLGENIGTLVSGLATVVKWGVDFAAKLGPKGTLALILGAKGLMSAMQWFSNGVMLAKGFNSAASGGGGIGDMLSSLGGKKGVAGEAAEVAGFGGKVLKGVKGLGKAAAPLALVSAGIDGITNSMDENLTTSEKFFKTLDQHKGMAMGAAIGSVIPGVGTAIGAGIGGIVDMFAPEIGTYGNKTHDGIFNSPMHDGMAKGLGSDFSKGRGIVQGGKITPIDNKDDLIAAKPNGVIASNMKASTPSSMKIEFGEIHFKFDELKVTSPGSPGVAINLLNDPSFIRSITKMVHVETDKAISGGKINPNPK